ncbi:MAG: hypothetical protein U0074_08450 [Kouleothrix sp.]
MRRALIAAYLIALVLELGDPAILLIAIAPGLGRAGIKPPYQAIFNVLGVIIMDLILMAWRGIRKGAAGQRQIATVKERAASCQYERSWLAARNDA